MRRDSGPGLTLSASRARAPGDPEEGGRRHRVGWVKSPTLRNATGISPTSKHPQGNWRVHYRNSAHAA